MSIKLNDILQSTLAEVLSQYVSPDHRDWDKFLPFTMFAYNSSVHKTTGYSPFFLLYGHEPTLPIDAALHVSPGLSLVPSNMELLRRWNTARELVLEREKQTQQSIKRLYDLTR